VKTAENQAARLLSFVKVKAPIEERRAPIKHPISFWNIHIDAWRLSVLSQKEYCRRHGLRDKAIFFNLSRRGSLSAYQCIKKNATTSTRTSKRTR